MELFWCTQPILMPGETLQYSGESRIKRSTPLWAEFERDLEWALRRLYGRSAPSRTQSFYLSLDPVKWLDAERPFSYSVQSNGKLSYLDVSLIGRPGEGTGELSRSWMQLRAFGDGNKEEWFRQFEHMIRQYVEPSSGINPDDIEIVTPGPINVINIEAIHPVVGRLFPDAEDVDELFERFIEKISMNPATAARMNEWRANFELGTLEIIT